MTGHWKNQQEINQLFKAPQFRKWRCAAMIEAGLVIALQICMIIWLDYIPDRTLLFLRGCVGLGAIIFVILIGILAYKVYSLHLRTRYPRK